MLGIFAPAAWFSTNIVLAGKTPRTHRPLTLERYGIRLLPELYEYLNPMPFDAAAQMEKDLAEDLRRAGFTVTGGH